jgi:hypothetical protein
MQPSPWRDLTLFAFGPALIACLIAAWFQLHPWPIPVAPQAQFFQLRVFGPMLLLGALGAWLSGRAGLPSAPSLADGRGWARLLGPTLLVGLLIAALAIGMDAMLGVKSAGARHIGAASIDVPLPWSIAHYVFGSIFVESTWRIGPIPLLAWLIGGLALRGRGRLTVFWVLAVLGSLIEPVGQGLSLGPENARIAVIGGVVQFAANLLWFDMFRRYGWPAPLIIRLVQELGLHVAWPLIAGLI